MPAVGRREHSPGSRRPHQGAHRLRAGSGLSGNRGVHAQKHPGPEPAGKIPGLSPGRYSGSGRLREGQRRPDLGGKHSDPHQQFPEHHAGGSGFRCKPESGKRGRSPGYIQHEHGGQRHPRFLPLLRPESGIRPLLRHGAAVPRRRKRGFSRAYAQSERIGLQGIYYH